MASRAYDFSIAESNIDSETSTISKVSLISIGQAKGHQLESGEQIWVDGKTLDQIYSCLVEMGTLKLKVDHGSGVMSTAGWIDGFEKKSGKIIGDMHVYDAEPEKLRMFEIAEKNPDHLGLSLEFSGDDEVLGNKAFARCDEVSAVALVSEPAANSSLFEKPKKNLAFTVKVTDKVLMAKTTKKLDATGSAGDVDATPDRAAMFEQFCKKYADDTDMMKKFDDFLTNSDGRPAPSGEGRNINPNVVPVVTDDDKSAEGTNNFEDDEKDEDMKDDDKKDDKVNEDTRMSVAVNAAVEKRMKQFAASLGTKLPTAGTGAGITGGKGAEQTFDSIVTAKAKEFGGDKSKAMLHCLELVRKQDPEMIKLYGASRSKILKVEPKANRYL